jgi:hypothetical protein
VLLLTELLPVELLLLLLGLLLRLRLLWRPLLLGCNTHVVYQYLLNHQAGEEFTNNYISIAALDLISSPLPRRIEPLGC